MDQLLPLVRVSAKKTFRDLRKKSPIHCEYLGSSVKIGGLFFDHISSSKKKRTTQEVIERLLLIPFVSNVLKLGELYEKRDLGDVRYYKFVYFINDFPFSLIVRSHRDKKFELISCFIHKKRDLS